MITVMRIIFSLMLFVMIWSISQCFEDRIPKLLPSRYTVYQSDQLPTDQQITTFLYRGETKTFFFHSTVENGSLSATIVSCSAMVNWKISSIPNNSDESTSLIVSSETAFNSWRSRNCTYKLEIATKDGDSYVHIYVSTEEGGPQALQSAKNHQLKLLKRQRKNRLTVRWEPSLVDPHVTEYCMVASTKKNYGSLCEAEANKFGVIPPKLRKAGAGPVAESQTVISMNEDVGTLQDPFINCVGKRFHYTLSNLHHNQLYYIDVFAINQQTNLTYTYASTSIKFDRRIKPITLKHNKPIYTNLKKLDGKAVFRYKVPRNASKPLTFFITPCGGLVDVGVFLNKHQIIPNNRIENFGQISIENPRPGVRYYVKVSNPNGKNSGVEIYSTTKSSSIMPKMPSKLEVYEYVELRRCDSVTVGWLPSPSQLISNYCLIIKEGKLREMEEFELPNQCGLEKRLKKSADFVLKYCKAIRRNKSVITERISQLKPGRDYIVQILVKKPKGKTLSYDLVQVRTLPTCSKLLE